MSEVYRRLCEVLMPPALEPLPFAADVRAARNWVDGLPRLNVNGTRAALLDALRAMPTMAMQGTQRQEILDVIRSAAIDAARATVQRYDGLSLPLSPELSELPGEVILLHGLLADGYRTAAAEVCAPGGALPWLKGNAVADLLNRAIEHYYDSIRQAWRIYRGLPSGIWSGLHRCARFAMANALDARAVKGQPPLWQRYSQLLLVALHNPLSYTQQDQDILWSLAKTFAAQCRFVSDAQPRGATLVVPLDVDAQKGLLETNKLWLDLNSFYLQVDQAIAKQARNPSAQTIDIQFDNEGGVFTVTVAMARKLSRAFDQATARAHSRLEASHRLETIFGLSSIHFHAAEQRDFERYVADLQGDESIHCEDVTWAISSFDRIVSVPTAQVLDQSLGGYRLEWGRGDNLRARVGEMIGLATDNEQSTRYWMLGVIRWLRYGQDGRVLAGVELISRHLRSVALLDDQGHAHRALELILISSNRYQYMVNGVLEKTINRVCTDIDAQNIFDVFDKEPVRVLPKLYLSHIIGDYMFYQVDQEMHNKSLPKKIHGAVA